MKQATLSLIVPARNIASLLERVIQDSLLVLPNYFSDYEIIIVDDGSDDATLTIAQQLAAAHLPVMIIYHPIAHGTGAALLNGIRNARGDYLLTYLPESRIGLGELMRLVPYLENHDLVLAYRYDLHPGWWARTQDRLAHGLANSLFGSDLHDIGSQFGLFHTQALADLQLTQSGRLLLAELYLGMRQQERNIIQVGVHMQAASQGQTLALLRVSDLPRVVSLALKRLRRTRPARPEPTEPVVPTTPREQRTAQHQWSQRMIWGLGLAILARSVWMLVRRREN